MEIKDIITIITASIGCFLGVANLVIYFIDRGKPIIEVTFCETFPACLSLAFMVYNYKANLVLKQIYVKKIVNSKRQKMRIPLLDEPVIISSGTRYKSFKEHINELFEFDLSADITVILIFDFKVFRVKQKIKTPFPPRDLDNELEIVDILCNQMVKYDGSDLH